MLKNTSTCRCWLAYLSRKPEQDEPLAELSKTVTQAKAGVHKTLQNLDARFNRYDAGRLLQ